MVCRHYDAIGRQTRGQSTLGDRSWDNPGLPPMYEEGRPKKSDREIYVVGAGALGTLVAHQLASLPQAPPITLLLHRVYSLENWKDVGKQLKVSRHGTMEIRKNVTAELISDFAQGKWPAAEIPTIRHLIVTVKAPFAAIALDWLKHRLTAESTIVFFQNGQGLIDELNERVFVDERTRPRYIFGTVTHGVVRDSPFSVTWRSTGTITLSLQPTMSVEEWEEQPWDQKAPGNSAQVNKWPSSSRYLMRTITRAPLLQAAGADPWEGMKISLLKLVGNAIINPLTAILDCRNGELLHSVPASRMMHLLLAEISMVLKSLPEVQTIKFREELFSPRSLKARVLDLCQATAANESSMLQDMRAGSHTEIDYINGWIVRRGEELGIKCLVNFALIQMVMAKSIVHRNSVEGSLPLEFPRIEGASSDPAWRSQTENVVNSNHESKSRPGVQEGTETKPSDPAS